MEIFFFLLYKFKKYKNFSFLIFGTKCHLYSIPNISKKPCVLVSTIVAAVGALTKVVCDSSTEAVLASFVVLSGEVTSSALQYFKRKGLDLKIF